MKNEIVPERSAFMSAIFNVGIAVLTILAWSGMAYLLARAAWHYFKPFFL